MLHDTPRGPERSFPATRRSIVERLGAAEPADRRDALARVIEAYWKPSYAYLRLRWRRPREEAQDLTQGFFAVALERDALAGFDPARGRFRTFLRTCLDRFAADAERSRGALKRGGAATHVGLDVEGLDFAGAESDLRDREPADPARADAWFDAEFRRSLLESAVDELRRECGERGHALRFELFRRHDLGPDERPAYEELAREHGIEVHAVTNALHAARRDLRRIVLERLRAWTRDEEEFQDELRCLFGGAAP